MNKSTKKYLTMLIALWVIGCLLQYLFCCRSNTTEKVVATVAGTAATAAVSTTEGSTSAKPTRLGFSLKGDGIDLSGEDNFNFVESDYVPAQPYTEDLEDNLAKTVDYLNEDPARQLTITGRYHPEESNSSAFPNIGLARANQVKDYLSFLGANSQQISLASKAYPEAVSDENKRYLGMADFSTETLDDASLTSRDQAMQALATDIRANPLTLYFKTGAAEINLSEAQRQRLLDIASYLDFDQSAKAVVTGHTDNTGDRDNNIRLGKERASFASDYLEKNGLRRAQLYVDSKGPDAPIADNGTEEGRAKNRRVTISIYETSQ